MEKDSAFSTGSERTERKLQRAFRKFTEERILSARVDGEIREIGLGMSVDRYKIHDIEIVIDKMIVDHIDLKRMKARWLLP